MGENVKNVFGLNICQLRKDAYPYRFCLGPFSYVLAVPSKIISTQEFTQTFALMTFSAQRAKFWLVKLQKPGHGRGIDGTSSMVHGAS